MKKLIKTYKGIKVYFNFQDSSLTAKDRKTGEEFKGKYLFEIEKQIDEPLWEQCDKKGFVVEGVFKDNIYLVVAKRKNTKIENEYDWVFTSDSTDSSYERGKQVNRYGEREKVYPFTEHNKRVFRQALAKQAEINSRKGQLREIINELKD